ncbi:MAG: hypothetical protein QY318_00920 [Candidatus Dojkabacteria bacterium]|nr:MAG: hypothetical protein QY318_00920 [Candidatus Dojkabacteria bacterium]
MDSRSEKKCPPRFSLSELLREDTRDLIDRDAESAERWAKSTLYPSMQATGWLKPAANEVMLPTIVGRGLRRLWDQIHTAESISLSKEMQIRFVTTHYLNMLYEYSLIFGLPWTTLPPSELATTNMRPLVHESAIIDHVYRRYRFSFVILEEGYYQNLAEGQYLFRADDCQIGYAAAEVCNVLESVMDVEFVRDVRGLKTKL